MKIPSFFTGCLLVLLSSLSSDARESRTFTNLQGKKIEAELIDVKDGKVRLLFNRKTVEVPLDTLSAEDQAWLAEQSSKPALGADEEKGGDAASEYTEVMFTDDFTAADFGKEWGHYKSESILKGGVLIGRSIDVKDHAGCDSVKFEGRQDLEISVKFNFAGEEAERFNVWMDDKDFTGSHAGHICSVFISPTGGNISDAKTGAFENTIYEKRKGGAELDDATKEMLAKKTVNFTIELKRETWHTLVIKTKGDLVTVSVNGYEIAKMQSEGVAHPTKSLVSLSTYANDVHYDDFSVRAAKAAPAPAAPAAP